MELVADIPIGTPLIIKARNHLGSVILVITLQKTPWPVPVAYYIVKKIFLP